MAAGGLPPTALAAGGLWLIFGKDRGIFAKKKLQTGPAAIGVGGRPGPPIWPSRPPLSPLSPAQSWPNRKKSAKWATGERKNGPSSWEGFSFYFLIFLKY